MRILVLNQYFHPDQSATSQLLTELCEDLAHHHEVFVVTGRPSYNPAEATVSRGILSRERFGSVFVMRVWSTGFNRSNMPGRLTNYATYLVSSAWGAIRATRPDVVMSLTDPPPIGLIGAAVARRHHVPFILVMKDVFPDVAIQLGALTNHSAIKLLRVQSRFLFDRASKIVSIGRDMNGRLEELGVSPEKIVTIHDWADGSLVRPLSEPSFIRKMYRWEDKFVVMHSGNVGLSQDLDTLIEAAALLQEHPDIVIAIVGDGAAKMPLMRKADALGLGNVEFIPYQPKGSLSESLGAADVHLVGLRRGLAGYIVPSKVYGILAAGKPFIAAVEPGSEPALIVEEYDCGIRVDPGDPVALSEAVLKLREAPVQEMGARGRRAFEQRFERSIATEAFRSMLEEVTAANGRR
jgi:colanic acid biosynthesis glycosyl transferase WcaI